MRRSFAYTFIPLFSDITAFYCIYLAMSFYVWDSLMTYSFPALTVCAAVTAFINCKMTEKEHALLFLIGVNLFLAVLTEVILFACPNNLEGAFAHICSAFIFLYPALRSAYLCREEAKAERMLVYCEISILGTGFYLCMQITFFHPGSMVNFACVAALVMNLFALSGLRIREAAKNGAGEKAGVQRGIILAGIILFFLGVASAIGLFLLPAGKDLIRAILLAIKELLLTAGRLFFNILRFLFSLLPGGGEGGLAPAPEVAAPPDLNETVTIAFSEEAKMVLLLFGVVIAAAAVLIVLYRLRKVRLRRIALDDGLIREKSEGKSLFVLLFAGFLRFARRLRFYAYLALRFDTCGGVFLRMEQKARRRGLPRSSWQTPREYIASIYSRVPDCTETEAAFLNLAAALDAQCFSASFVGHAKKMEKEQIRVILRALDGIPSPGRTKPGVWRRRNSKGK